ncbi:thiopurine S-methyltransferase [Bacteriovorax sp. BAL6_X]|uniref:hypothetical protein n=1 Tax=Bacteriovorax sp. BAL6_X TaxID=1201290 RepID=UPI0003857D5A|nr:hypothetical protein [Bacteriovorax sp. BAL6_X]EPZ50933.1 thiopurine S-methyltransferase [Bacteriovorax sp. BAL6_X]
MKIETNQKQDNAKFWQEGWDKGFTGFHQSEYNQAMIDYFKDLDLNGKIALIPLCGKSLDMLYLANKGAKVIGVEVVKEPVEQFFKENEIEFDLVDSVYTSKDGQIEIHNKDFFKIKDLGRIDYLYDRASNVALPKCMREQKYYPTIKRLIQEETKTLLITMDHDGSRDFGPPYAIHKKETKDHGPSLKLINESSSKAMQRFQEEGIRKIKRFIWAN